VACFYNSHRVIRLEWRGGLKHYEKPVSHAVRHADSERRSAEHGKMTRESIVSRRVARIFACGGRK
jgi:hypothetical protein